MNERIMRDEDKRLAGGVLGFFFSFSDTRGLDWDDGPSRTAYQARPQHTTKMF